MKLASLFSGGKDSAYSVFLARRQGHAVRCLLTVFPKSGESHLLHYPNIAWTGLQARSMRLPHVAARADFDSAEDEDDALKQVLLQAKNDYGVDGLVHGGILSEFQRSRFEDLCGRCDLEVLSPLWGADPRRYMDALLDDGFEYVVTSVSSGGLDGSWLGRRVGRGDVGTLARLSEEYGFNMAFEGGEAETFVTGCPLFSSPIEIVDGRSSWDGYRGMFEITDARLTSNA